MGSRRVVTGERDGKSCLLSDTTVPSTAADGPPEVLWRGDPIPALPNDGTFERVLQFPAPGGVWLATWALAPGTWVDSDSAAIETSGERPGFHRTDSIDIDMVLSGTLVLELDDGAEIELSAVAVAFQNGNQHAWHNRGTEEARVVVTIVGAQRQVAP